MSRRGRGRLTAMDLLPDECTPLIARAAEKLLDKNALQTEIYEEFFDECQRLMAESRGELEFSIPSKSSFNRFSIRLEAATRRMAEAKEIAKGLAARFDPETSDELALIAGVAIQSLVVELLTSGHDFDPKSIKALADALRASAQAQNLSTVRRQKVEADFASKVDEAVETVAKAKGLTRETVDNIKSEILGIGR